MSPLTDTTDSPLGWHKVVLRWSVGVGVVCAPLLVLGVSWKVTIAVLGFALLILFLALWDSGENHYPFAPVPSWYEIEFDDEKIYLVVDSDTPWRAEIPWETIHRICLEMAADPSDSDSIYLWVDGRENSFPIPFEARNGEDLLQEFLERELFPKEPMIEAMGGLGEVFCHEIRPEEGECHPELLVETSGQP